ncbi:Respiratory nitrate reductase 1 alpha chain [Neobacillus rhizosphaerae]|uniref:nitrate reductase (quinone) n=1 Tax=Neobacillus rhizosphaerae TaxID=2880965 RepID=A0ABN8KQ71_9BACI|nr:nitrate reductase subunit alpha [Neobacillus rhizosphaerae]CAH2715811.1 Respiratory nitrate reductase 1 alpha chain [Neobacillus rhizosphaerae]
MKTKSGNFLKKLRYFKPIDTLSDGWSQLTAGNREWENVYRQRWSHDKVVRTTHGVNCTGSCSWKVFVKEGIITWENQQTDYPSCGPDMPEFEPRGCPRGASFSWYVYSPLRVKYPYVRGVLLKLYREALKQENDPVKAWASIVENPEKAKEYKSARGKGGFIRATKEEVNEMISASLIYTTKKFGPDRIAGFTPIPAMSMVSYAAGSRFLSMLGAPMLSFYDWYADLPPASPQIWGEQTDVPESSDWYNSGYIMMWGSNVPMTRTPDAHFMTEVRYKGTKVVTVSPDYAENVKFADDWLPIQPGEDAALAQAMTHVILKEFYVDKKTDYFFEYAQKYTDLPYLITLKQNGSAYISDRFLTASDLGMPFTHAEWKTAVIDQQTGKIVIPNGSIGHRWGNKGQWNLLQQDEQGNPFEPELTVLGQEDHIVDIDFPFFDRDETRTFSRPVPVKKVVKASGEEIYVTTVFDLMLAHYGVNREELGKGKSFSYEDPQPYTPAWQEKYTGIDKKLVVKIAREFAENAVDTKGRSMIIMGAGINHWFNGDTIYRSILNLVLLTGSQGVNGGGWAHYVGQEKCRVPEGWGTIAFGRDWSMPPRLQNATSFYYFATDQWRYEETKMNELASPLVKKARYRHSADYNVLAARLGWLPSYPQFNRNSLELYEEAQKAGAQTTDAALKYVVNELKTGKMEFAIEDPDHPVNFPRNLFVWRSNLISSSGKGHEYFLKHLLGTSNGLLGEENHSLKPEEMKWRAEGAEGKLDLLVSIDFRMAGNALYSDIVLPAATWYEKHDISSTDMHPFVHPFNPAINPPWEAQSDWDTFKGIAKTFSKMAEEHFPKPIKDLVTVPLQHDTPDEIAQPFGKVLDWKKGEAEAVPGVTMPRMMYVDRDYKKIYEKFIALGPLVEKNPVGAHGISFSVADQYQQLKDMNGTVEIEGISYGMPSIETGRQAAEAMMTLSSATNGQVAMKAWEAEEAKTGLSLKDIAEDQASVHHTFQDISIQPRKVIPTPVFTGSNKGNKRYSPFTTNIERFVPFRTLTGRQHFYLDHEIISEYGENFPIYKPTLPEMVFSSRDKKPKEQENEITLRYLTPHGKWNIHSTYQDNLTMLTLFRGGPHVWMSEKDAEQAGIQDNDWVEVYNRNGVVAARAVTSHKMPKGTLYMYHAQDKHINTPGTTITGERAGTHNSPTKIHVKPTQIIGGYAQLSYGFNYYGPIGNQRDIYVSVRKMKEVPWLED